MSIEWDKNSPHNWNRTETKQFQNCFERSYFGSHKTKSSSCETFQLLLPITVAASAVCAPSLSMGPQ